MRPKPKICLVTTARSEYGVMRPLITLAENDPSVEFMLVVSGAHFDPAQGMTVRQIEADGHKITAKADFGLRDDSRTEIIRSMGRCMEVFADVFAKLQPDIAVVVGDRYELLPICSAALVANVPLAHVSGGDVTEGAIDNQVRNAVSAMAEIHFPGNAASAANVARITGSADRIFNVGEPGLENIRRLDRMTRRQLADELGIDVDRQWISVTLHPETRRGDKYNTDMAVSMLEAISAVWPDDEVVITAANTDNCGRAMNSIYRQAAADNPRVRFFESLGVKRYISLVDMARAMVGNSSSGLLEAPSMGVPAVNIGDRQRGRHLCRNVISCTAARDDIERALKAVPDRHFEPDNYYGDGFTASKILDRLKEYLSSKK